MTREIKILSGGAMRGLLDEAVPLFQRASGMTVTAEFGLTSTLSKAIEDGATFDIALLPRPELDALAKHGKIVGGSASEIAHSAIGVAVRAGAPKPDITTADAFKSALLKAESMTYSDGPSGAYVAGLLARLGIAQVMRPKTKLTTGPVAELVARGQAEIGVQQIVAILPIKGAELVGPLPSGLQNIITYAAGLSTRAQDDAVARTFIAFMATPDVTDIIRRKGMVPANGPRN